MNIFVDADACPVVCIVEKIANSHIQAESVLNITFDETSDFSFLESIYNLIDETFSFLCNRRKEAA